MVRGGILGVATPNRWLVTFIVVALVVLVADLARPRRNTRLSVARVLGFGCIIAAPLVGPAIAAPARTSVWAAAVGGATLALMVLLGSRLPRSEVALYLAVAIAAVCAVLAGAELGPTGVGAIDVIGGVGVIVAATFAFDGLARSGGATGLVGVLAGAGLFALAGFDGQNALAALAAGVTAMSLVSIVVDPTSLEHRALRLAVGYTTVVGVFALEPVRGAGRPFTTPLLLLGLLLLDAVVAVSGRFARRVPILGLRPDHLVERIESRGRSRGFAAATVVLAQFVLAAVALFAGRAVLSNAIAVAIAALVLSVVGIMARRPQLQPLPTRRLRRLALVAIGTVIVAVIVVSVPVGLAAVDAYDAMQDGRDDATAALAAARDGDTRSALNGFRSAAAEFARARDRLESPLLEPSLAVPYLSSNVRAARALCEIGTDLAEAGSSLTAAVDPDSLNVVDGRLPLAEVARITPKLADGAQALHSALERLNKVRADVYLSPPVRSAVDKVHTQLVRAAREANHAVAAARLAPAIFGGEGERRYLLVVQNNAESRATGGFIGSYGTLTANDGKLDVSRLLRTASWNSAVRAAESQLIAPRDYARRYAQFLPATTLQNVNLSPDFPSVAAVLMNLAPAAGVGPVDGVIAVDPVGLAALLELTGPVEVEGWPTPIDAGNVVDVTLKEAYAAFESTPERADFLGDVAQAVVDRATTGNLGKPPQLAKTLGRAAHEGHLILAFSRPDEEQLARELGVAGDVAPVPSDALAVTTSNAGANKIDVYLQRTVTYDVSVHPDIGARKALVAARASVVLENQAPDTGLPQEVIGPAEGTRFAAGENRTLLSVYSPLGATRVTVDGTATGLSPGRELGRNVSSRFQSVAAGNRSTVVTDLAGQVRLRHGWYELELRHQPTLNADRVHVVVEVPNGWRIVRETQMRTISPHRAETTLVLERNETLRVQVSRDPGALDLWDRLVAGT